VSRYRWHSSNAAGGIDAAIFAKLIADQKVPAGSIDE